MARARNIKPGFYKNEDLAECSVWARLLFPGLWMLADREGRMEDRPKRIKGEIFPFDSVEVEPLLAELEKWKFIIRYETGGTRYIQITNFTRHQKPHSREKASEIPCPGGYEAPPVECQDVEDEDDRHDLGSDEARPRHDLGSDEARPWQCRARPDSLIADSLIADSLNQKSVDVASAIPPSSEVAREPAESARASPSPPGEVCRELRSAGITGVNPSHPKLLALLAAGLTTDEIASIAKEPQARGKGMAWVLAAAEGRRRDAARVQDLPRARPMPGGGISGAAVGLGRIL